MIFRKQSPIRSRPANVYLVTVSKIPARPDSLARLFSRDRIGSPSSRFLHVASIQSPFLSFLALLACWASFLGSKDSLSSSRRCWIVILFQQTKIATAVSYQQRSIGCLFSNNSCIYKSVRLHGEDVELEITLSYIRLSEVFGLMID